MSKSFRDYKEEGHLWITLSTGAYYPDILPLACELYKPVLVMFGELLARSHSSTDLFMAISETNATWMRVQLARVFRKYVSPETPVEMLKRKRDAQKICDNFGAGFRVITEVQKRFLDRLIPDEPLCALLWEYKDRGKKGYDLTERMFVILRESFPDLKMSGPERAGQDILMKSVFPDYPKGDRPIDFMICDNEDVLAIGLARYDSDRGGAQEDDRTGQYRDCASEVLSYAASKGLQTKVIFLNDGPGLLLGTMWNDYSNLEEAYPGKVMVTTLRMLPDRLSEKWLRG
jgi:hypothetical protein